MAADSPQSFKELDIVQFANHHRKPSLEDPCQNICGLATALDGGEPSEIFCSLITTLRVSIHHPSHVLFEDFKEQALSMFSTAITKISSDETLQDISLAELLKLRELLENREGK